MAITSSLLNEKTMRYVKESVEKVSAVDNLEDFRVQMLEYIDDSAQDNDDEFFYDWLVTVRFLAPGDSTKMFGDEVVACTTPQKLIFLNSPGVIGKNIREWDFIYCHECLHQLWETFAVQKQIENETGSCDHKILNIASDCVINDYLTFFRNKPQPKDGVTPEALEKELGVIYDRREDTQYTLYMKLIEKKNELYKNPKMRQIIDLQGKTIEIDLDKLPPGPGPQPPQPPLTIKNGKIKIKGKRKGGGGGGPKPDIEYEDVDIDTSEMEPDEAAQSAQDSADQANQSASQAQQNANDAKQNGGSGADSKQAAADKAKDAAKRAQAAANKAKSAASKGDKEGAQEAAKEAASAAKEAADAEAESGGGNGSGSGGGDSEAKAINDMSSSEAAEDARNSANVAKEAVEALERAAQSVAGNEDIDADDLNKRIKTARKCAEAAEKAAKAAEAYDSKGNAKGAQEAAKEARAQARQALTEVYNSEGDPEQDITGNTGNSGGGGAKGWGSGTLDPCMSKIDLDKLRKEMEDKLDRYSNKISGDLGHFVEQCSSSKKLKKDGLRVTVRRGVRSWHEKMDKVIDAYIRARVFQNKREYEKTYKKPNRRKGILKPGDIISPGRRIKRKEFIVNMAFYIDRSGSMDSGNARQNAFKAAYTICEATKKQYKNNKFVDDVAFKMYSFDDDMMPIPYGKVATSGGGTMPFHQIFKFMADNTDSFLVNIIITDGETSMDEAEIVKYVNQLEGKFIFICNSHNIMMDKLAKKYPLRITYILADSNFSI